MGKMHPGVTPSRWNEGVPNKLPKAADVEVVAIPLRFFRSLLNAKESDLGHISNLLTSFAVILMKKEKKVGVPPNLR